MEIKREDACQALIDGKLVIAYFGKNGDYKLSHLGAPLEIRVIGNTFCTYTSPGGVSTRKLKGKNIMKALCERFDVLDIHPVFILDKRPIGEPLN
ncbi:hypothetical protein [Bacteroides sp.]|uniref:hypothetical protein n=1 Tax=Bacteroides sp. TaxID=29523 RepID=UPI0026259927|nr:hypothetical protein [Bacteroides sp.]MDD3038843.1 hypothetical protein [Bacteroides sp.]